MLSSFVRSMKSCFGGIIISFCFLALFEMMVFSDDMVIWLRLKKMKDDVMKVMKCMGII